MKNETARREIESLDYYLQNHTNDYSEESHTAMMMAIKALEQQPCEDCISRQAVLDMATTIQTDDFSGNEIIEVVDIDDIKALPPVQPTRPTGKWIRDTITDLYHCSECRTIYHQDVKTMDNFCPNCGARMAESEAEA